MVCTATDYGGSLLEQGGFSHIRIRAGRLAEDEMRALMEQENISIVVDATHPYAALASENIAKACKRCGCRYIRLQRASGEITEDCVKVPSLEKAVDYLQGTEGAVLAATGSRDLETYTKLKDYKRREKSDLHAGTLQQGNERGAA